RRKIYAKGSEEWIVFGSPQSDVRLRIYNKALEKGFKGEKWVRFEYQLRNDGLDRFLNHLLHCDDLGQAFKDFVSESVRFLKKVPDKVNANAHRVETAKWWNSFVSGAGMITEFSRPGVQYNMTALTKYLSQQVGPSMATYIHAYEGDTEKLLDLAVYAGQRMNAKQKHFSEEFISGNR
ncbi:MAG: replication initiation factor domain-containing protein, partial [Clostridia bacterium]|nr:replication initiation factor domain-containing protein [Clostridia bacterium]